jgi:HPt (histidine-containing phosphotransfer) domain-containing protein
MARHLLLSVLDFLSQMRSHSSSFPSQVPVPTSETVLGAAEMAQLRREFPGGAIGEIVEMFKAEGPMVLQQIAAALVRVDVDGVRRGAHALKGGCGNFGARSLESICHALETEARRGNIASAPRLLAQAWEEFHRVETSLERECQLNLPS